jgi:hypothetical protein
VVLPLHFAENLPIQAIAAQGATGAARLHHPYALARRHACGRPFPDFFQKGRAKTVPGLILVQQPLNGEVN